MSIGLGKKKLLASVSNADFLKELSWRGSAPKKMVKAASSGDCLRFVIAYRAWLEPSASRYRKHLPTGTLCQIGRPEPGSLARLIAEYKKPEGRFRKGVSRAIAGWLQGPLANPMSEVELAAVSELLLNPPIDLEAEPWLQLWRRALTAKIRSGKSTLSAGLPPQTEASIIQALLFAPLTGSVKQHHASAKQIEEDLLAVTDTDGTPHASIARELTQLFATLVRCGWWGRAFRQPAFTEKASERFEGLLTRATELCRADGGFSFEAEPLAAANLLLPLASRIAQLPKKSEIARVATGDWKPEKKNTEPPASQSDWSAIACLRSNRSPQSDSAIVTYDENIPQLELSCFGQPILSGQWLSESAVAGKKLTSRGEWSCSCWFSDEDGDYLELERSAGRAIFERQLYLSRKQHFMLLSDCVRTRSDKPIAHQLQIPLARKVMSRADFVSREWRLHSGQFPVRVFPVSLEFDRIQSTCGQLAVHDNLLTLEVQGRGNLVASVVFDWHPDRTETDAEWTQLTVTETRQFVPRSDASAFRLRSGDHQIVSYRNISDSKQLRTVLGQHVNHESVIGTLGSSGVFEPLVLVDHPADETD